ncbi:MAG: insulinase family protein [Flavobacteriaceae bacterium]|nr:insulinase family protein [Flavobacteriaceae bacterium]
MKKLLVLICFTVLTYSGMSAQSYKLPEFTKFKLDNGLTIYLMEQHDVPLISISAILPAGAIYDGDKSGLARLTALSLKHGTKNFTKSKIDETLDFIGAGVNVSASKEYATLSSKFATKDKNSVMTIVKELLREPIFDESEFDKEKSRALVELETAKESPKSVIGDYFDKLLFGDHVYSNSISGTKESLESITINDIKNFYNTNFTPNNAAISIAGDFNSDEMKEIITSLFSDWKKGTSILNNLASQPIIKLLSGQVLLVNKDDANETTFYIGAPGVSRNNKDIVAIQVVNTLFGGRFTSMLNEELRINSGLTYGAGSRFRYYKNGGAFYINTFTANETTEQAIDLALEVTNRLHTKGIDEKSLSSAKNYIKGQFPPRYETVNQLSDFLIEMFWYDFDENYINDFEKNVDGLTLEKAKKIINTYFPKDNYQIVLIGKASEIEKIAVKYGTVKQVDIKD